jgi:cyclohexanone monooxygenase
MGTSSGDSRSLRVAVIGAGPGGLHATKELKAAGLNDVVVLEKCGGVGGTWYINRYPGCACDVQSHLYSFTSEINRDWSRPYAPQPEILAYLEGIARRYGLLQHCQFNTEVVGAVWDDRAACWRLQTASGEQIEAEVVVSAVGMFKEPAMPDIDGVEGFAGTVFHSARWRWDHDLTGESVAVVGSAASAVQFVPEIVKTAGRVHLFQRTANWVLPKPDTPYTDEELEHFRSDPRAVLQLRDELYRTMDEGMTFSDAKVNAEREAIGLAAIDVVEDPEIRRKLRPDHPFGCKRPLFSNVYYRGFNEPNLELVTEPIERITAHAIITSDGTQRHVDTLILATGFSTTKYLSVIDVVGRHGRRITDVWEDGAQAYLGITTSGFPNLFMIYGPNTNNGSILTMIENQVAHIVAHVRRLVEENLAWVDVKPGPMGEYDDEVQRAIGGIGVWQADCNGYYRTRNGRIVTQWPFSMSEFAKRTATLDLAAFETHPRASRPTGTDDEHFTSRTPG